MKLPSLQRFFIAVVTFLFLSLPRTALALDLIVEHNPTDPSHFSTIQAAIDYAGSQLAVSPAATFRVVVEANTVNFPYSAAFSPISNVPIIGSETATTWLSGSGPGPLIAMNGVNNVTIKNFTIISGAVGISVTNSSAVTIANNIFNTFTPGAVNTAIQVQGSPTTTIVNNTFYQNGTALSTNDNILVTNNIFSTNGTAILTAANLSRLTYNAYHNNTNNGAITLDAHSLPNSSVTNPDPLFVDPSNNVADFHLQGSSPCHRYGGGNAGNPGYPNAVNPAFADMGAYGGPDSDTVPAMVTGLAATGGATANSIALKWLLNRDYQVTGYHVYYGTTSGDRSGTGASEGNSPLTITQGVNSATLSNLPLTPPTTPGQVTGVFLGSIDQALHVGWRPAANATGYRIYYSTTDFSAASLPATFIQVNGANPANAFLYGLTNGVTYFVAVSAVAQSTYFLTVTAFNAGGGTPGVSNESSFAPEVAQYFGTPLEGALSNSVSASPHVISVGNLSFGGGGGGCFIATAAYGCYSAPHVQVLRDFRDRFLLTNAPGRAFVAWYYHYGPYGADFITVHPWCKPIMRLLLLPLVGGAMFVLNASLPTKCVVMVVVLVLSGAIIRRKRTRRYVG